MKAVQSAMAIRRQRHRREEQRRAKARRNSHLSDNCILSPTASCGSIVSNGGKTRAARNQEGFSTVTSFHVGIVFLFMGSMLIISGSIPGYTDRDWENLLGTGSFLLAIGIGLLVINKFASSKEDEQFTEYISSKMAAPKDAQPVTPTAANEAHRLVHEDLQLESIIEETPDVHDQVHWTDEVAPVHNSHRQHKSRHNVHNHHQVSHP